jgi:uncharacterized protein (TIGR02145 family)
MKKFTLLAFALALVACGEDSVTEKIVEVKTSSVEIVADISLLPSCSANNEGEMYWVQNEKTPRMCSDGKWYAVAEESVAATCVSEPLPDASGYKILCGGDSVGVVLNGLDGKDGDQGVPGERGDQGDAGKSGADGDAAANGKDGVDGKNGTDGAPGAKGKDGVDGKDGAPGTDGKDGKDGGDGKNGTNCVLEEIDQQTARVICGADSTILYVGAESDTLPLDSVVLDSEKIAISLNQVSGVTQKGPFLSGSKVLVREMEDGRTLTQTGYSFNGKILNDNGEFRINARMLVSQYVMLEATGYYRNEVTGKNSNSELTLFAITDVNDRNVVNVNLLTHLEYERVIYLVTQKKMKVRAAKKQAQKEVFGLLNIDATDFSNSEDLNIAGESDADAALLAFSVVLQGDRSESELSELLTKIATDMEKDGAWNDSATRKSLADWAFSIDDTVRIKKIRENVENWGLSESVPNFEKYVRNFWSVEYGLGECSETNRGEVVSAQRGPASNRYICGRDHLWRVATDFEKDTYQWADTTDGVLKAGDITGKMYVYDPNQSYWGEYAMDCFWNYSREFNEYKYWREARELEIRFGCGCTASHWGELRKEKDEYSSGGYSWYECSENEGHRWINVSAGSYDDRTSLKIDTKGWKVSTDGDARWGDSIGVADLNSRRCYVYDTSNSFNGYRYVPAENRVIYIVDGSRYPGWQVSDTLACALGIQGCTEGKEGLMLKANNGAYYVCQKYGYYVKWRLAPKVAYNTLGWDCLDSNEGEMRRGQVNDAYFVCEDGGWRESSVEEELNCRENGVCRLFKCTSKKKGLFAEIDGALKVCDYSSSDYEWREPNCAEKKTRSLCFNESAAYEYAFGSAEYNSTVVWDCEDLGNFKVDYLCRNNAWRAISSPLDYPVDDWNKKKSEYYTQAKHPNAVYGEDLVDGRDNEVYKTVIIGGKRWMAENLRYMDDSTNLAGNATCATCYTASYTYEQCMCERGRYYALTAAMNVDSKWGLNVPPSLIQTPHRGICPENWHIPDSTEWAHLLKSVDDVYALQATGYADWPLSTDASGFSILPLYRYNGYTVFEGSPDYFWSATVHGSSEFSPYGSVYVFPIKSMEHSDVKLSVRCVAD